MNIQEALLKRRSIRKYTNEEVDEQDLKILLEAATSGPSACNRRPWAFYVISNKEVLAQLRKATPYSSITAPCAIVVCGDLSKALPSEAANYWVQDCSAATENILLQAVELGLGTVWCGVHPQSANVKAVKEILQLPKNHRPLNIIYVGHPDTIQPARHQYEDTVVTFIK